MSTREIEKGQWQNYFDQISRQLMVMTVDVEVTSDELGAQVEVEAIQLQGLSYDPRDDAFSIVTEELEHRILHPTEILVEEDAQGLVAIQITDGESTVHIARFMRALPLPSPQEGAGA